jgi:hypothetical protein
MIVNRAKPDRMNHTPKPPESRHWYDKIVAWGPLLVSIGFVVTMASDRLRPLLAPHLRENGPLELATFIVLAIAGSYGLRIAFAGRQAQPWWNTTFFAIFGSGLLLVALEEIAWGQTLLGFASPDYFQENNQQGETTLHNLGGAHGNSHYLYMTFCLGGLAGAYLPERLLGDLRVPRAAIPALWVIFFLTLFEFLHFALELDWAQHGVGRKAPELVEFWVACVGFLYCGEKWRALRLKK